MNNVQRIEDHNEIRNSTRIVFCSGGIIVVKETYKDILERMTEGEALYVV
jgi:hypothetical protein